MSTTHQRIAGFHEEIVRLRGSGRTWRQVAEALSDQGLRVDFNALVRYAKKTGLPTQIKGTVHNNVENDGLSVKFIHSSVDGTGVVPAEPVLFESWLPTSDDWQRLPGADVLPGAMEQAVEGVERAKLGDDPTILQRNWAVIQKWLDDPRTPKVGPARARVESAIFSLRRFMMETIPASAGVSTAASLPVAAPSEGQLFQPLSRESVWEPQGILLHFGNEEDTWSMQDSWEGSLILGATGSGKTSGSGRMLATSFLTNQYGGLVLTAKEDEADLWRHYARQTGREAQLCIVRPGEPFKFNFLDYQSRLRADRGGAVENVVELFHAILEAYSRNKRKADSFWANTARQLFRNLVRIIRAAECGLDFMTIRKFLSEVPLTAERARTGDWKQSVTFGRLLTEAKLRSRGKPNQVEADEALLYWTVELPALCEETRSIIVTDFLSMADLFFDPSVWDLFCGETTIIPEAVFDGAIIVVDLPIKRYLSIGRIAQVIWKHLFQLAVERRNDPNDASRRPVFLWADEAQNFWSDHDGFFQATARSSRCATVYLTQNIPAFYAQVGGELAKERVDGFLANLCTKVFHSNNDPYTNQWAAEQLGKSMQYTASINHGEEPAQAGVVGRGRKLLEFLKESGRSRVTTSPVMDFEVPPSKFTALQTGTKRCNGLVESYVVKSGAQFASTGKHYLRATFQQEMER